MESGGKDNRDDANAKKRIEDGTISLGSYFLADFQKASGATSSSNHSKVKETEMTEQKLIDKNSDREYIANKLDGYK